MKFMKYFKLDTKVDKQRKRDRILPQAKFNHCFQDFWVMKPKLWFVCVKERESERGSTEKTKETK
jgi:hypothetical protein